jgi:NADPH:quinone reductase-like Zn-dependent oxidoreductase
MCRLVKVGSLLANCVTIIHYYRCADGAYAQGTDAMKVVEIREIGSYDGLRIVERAKPVPEPGVALVRLHAASLNFRDLLIPLDRFPVQWDFSHRIPLSDGAGEVVAVGPGVTRVKPGDRVAATPLPDWLAGDIQPLSIVANYGFNIDGMAAEYAALDADALVILPDYLSFAEAAALPCAAVSAWSCLTEGRRSVRAGDTVLVLGSGGVSLFALQFAKAFGARVIATTSSDQKAARLREFGADAVVNYNTRQDWDEAVRELTDGMGVDRVIEVGGAGTFERSIASARIGGHISCVGFVSGQGGSLTPTPMLLTRALSVNFFMMGSRSHFEAMLLAMKQSEVHPVIDRIFPMTEIAAAYAHLESGRHMGKIVVDLV